MRITVDTNAVIAGLIRDSAARHVIMSETFQFNMPGNGVAEIRKYSREIMEKAGYTEAEFESILFRVFFRIELASVEKLKEYEQEADRIIGKIDENDSQFVAACLATNSEGIWTFDRHFERQKAIRIFKVDELLEMT